MAIKIGSLQVDLRLLSARFDAGMSAASTSLGKFSRGIRSTSGTLAKLTAGLTAVAGLGGAGLFAATQQAAQLADQLAKSADAVGLTTDAYQELLFASDKAGVSQSQFNSNLTAFVKRVGEARVQTGPLVSFLKKYDEELLVAIQNTSTQEQAFNLIAQAIEDAGTATDRAAIANAAFSRAGVGMVNVLRDGVSGLEGWRDRARETGVVIEESLLRQAEAANDELSVLAAVIRSRVSVALLQLAPQIDSIARSLTEALPAVVNFVQGFFGIETAQSRLSDAIVQLAKERDQLLSQRQQRSGGVRGWIAEQLNLESKEELELRLNEINEVILSKQRELQELQAAPAALPPPLPVPELDTGRQQRLQEQREREIEATRLQLATKLQILEESLLTEEERERLHFERRLEILNQAFADGLIPTEERWREISQQLEDEHQKKITALSRKGCQERATFEQSCQQKRIQSLAREFSTVTSGVAQHNKALFRINQVAAIANAVMNAHQGAARTLGAYPWPIGAVLAGIHLAAGVAQVSQIASASFGGGQPSPSLRGGGATSGTIPTIPAGQIGESQATVPVAREVSITLQGAGYSKQNVRELIEAINEELGDGVSLAVA